MNATNVFFAVVVLLSAVSGVVAGKDDDWEAKVVETCAKQAEILFPAERDSAKRAAAEVECRRAFNSSTALVIRHWKRA